MKKLAFTYAEILTIVLIIGLVSSLGMISFFDFLKGREINVVGENITSFIASEDSKITNKEVSDYEIEISPGDSIIVKENIFDSLDVINILDNRVYLNRNLNDNEKLEILIFENSKLVKSESISSSELMYNFIMEKDYTINSSIIGEGSKKKLNDIIIYRLNEEDNENKISINRIENNGSIINLLKLKNIEGKKELYSAGNPIPEDSVDIYLSNDGTEKSITINK